MELTAEVKSRQPRLIPVLKNNKTTEIGKSRNRENLKFFRVRGSPLVNKSGQQVNSLSIHMYFTPNIFIDIFQWHTTFSAFETRPLGTLVHLEFGHSFCFVFLCEIFHYRHVCFPVSSIPHWGWGWGRINPIVFQGGSKLEWGRLSQFWTCMFGPFFSSITP